jgi:hypothetical protein
MKKQILALSCLMATSLSANPAPTNFHLTGTIGHRTQVELPDLDLSDSIQLFSGISDAEMDGGSVETADAVQIRNVSTNKPIELKIRNNGWTLPTGYDSDFGNKTANGNDTDLKVRVNTGTLASTEGSIAVQGDFGTQYVGVNNLSAKMVKLGETTGDGKKHGVKDAVIDLDTMIVLDPVYDIPGTYSVEFELTVGEAS